MDIYDGIGLLALKGVMFFRGGSTPIHLHLILNCVQNYMGIYDGILMLALKSIVVIQMGIYSQCTSKYTDIYGAVGFFTLWGW